MSGTVSAGRSILAVLLFSAMSIWQARHPARAMDTEAKQRLSTLVSLVGGHAPRTVFAAVSSGCAACKADVPFLRKLSEAAQRTPERIDFILLFPEKDPAVDRFLTVSGLKGQSVRRMNLFDLGITRIPLLAVAEHDGVISHIWTGSIGEDRQTAVLKAITD